MHCLWMTAQWNPLKPKGNGFQALLHVWSPRIFMWIVTPFQFSRLHPWRGFMWPPTWFVVSLQSVSLKATSWGRAHTPWRTSWIYALIRWDFGVRYKWFSGWNTDLSKAYKGQTSVVTSVETDMWANRQRQALTAADRFILRLEMITWIE